MAVTSVSAIRGGLLASLRQGSGESRGSSQAPDNSKNVFCYFRPPFDYTDGLGGAAGTASGNVALLRTGEGEAFSAFVVGEFSGTAPQIQPHARGAVLEMDASATNDGLVIDLGYGVSASEIANCRGAFVVGTDDAFYVRVRLDIGDVSDTTQCAVGFVKGGTVDAALLGSYTDFAVLNVNAGDIKIETRLNSGTASATDTTQNIADYGTTGDVYDLEVRVSDSGAVNFLINGAEPTVDVTNFTFDTGDTVNAIFTVLGDVTAGGDPTVVLHEWESGFLSARGPDTIFDLED